MTKNGLVDNYLLSEQVEYFQDIINNNQTFLLTTHVHPDGDAIGSELSLYYLLKSFGKQVSIINNSPIPELYHFLDTENVVQTYKRELHKQLLSQIDVCFVLDIGDWERLRIVGEDLNHQRVQTGNKLTVICIDHHPLDEKIGDYDIIFPHASSTGEILFLLQNSLNIPFSIEAANALYISILTDTGSFRFNNTSVTCHFIAGFLINLGVDHNLINHQIYNQEPVSKIQLLAELLTNLRFECDFRIVWYTITQEMLKRHKLEPYQIEGISDFPRRIKGIKISILFMEIDDLTTKVSFRSARDFPINGFARRLGGGGHPFASGAMVRKSLESTINEVIEKICLYYKQKLFPGAKIQ